uniref:ParB/Sulfiredoxin domain-containing protein n=1 Tax=Geobacillus sp. (strain Y4.1MC1) TaxID=581103 RepID=A0A7U3YD34_GEOS0
MAYEIKTIDIDKIIVNVLNPRYEPQESELKEMDLIINNGKIIELIKDIAQYGLDPSENLIVSYDKELDAYISEEGNRRITAIKILNDPDLIPSFTKNRDKLINQVKKIKEKARYSYIKEVNCVIIDDEDTKHHFIELKHTGENKGAGRVRWNTESQARFRSTDKFREHLLKFLKSIHPEIKDSFGLTTVERIISDPDMRDAIGLTIDKKNQEIKLINDNSKQKLYFILDGLLTKKFNVNTFRHKEDRQKFAQDYLLNDEHQPWKELYIEAIKNNQTTKNNEKIVPTQDNLNQDYYKESNSQKDLPNRNDRDKGNPNQNDRNQGNSDKNNSNKDESFIDISNQTSENKNNNGRKTSGRPPKDIRDFDILTKAIPFKNQYRKNKRINQILKEMSQINYKENPISSMYLIRSILETYVHKYIDYFASLDRHHPYKMKNIPPQRDKRRKELKNLIYEDIYNHLKNVIQDYADTYELIRVTFTDNNQASAMQIINYYIHSGTDYPDSIELLEAWNKISTIIKTLDELLAKHADQK